MIVVSTSGFSYQDWKGPFYPADLPQKEQLPFFSRFFNAVELNYSYYTIPGARGIAGHMNNAPGMKFALKGHSSFTHQRQYGDRELDAYKNGMKQLRDGGALIAMLLQFPYSFHANEANFTYLNRLLDEFSGYPVAVEFRHARWKSRQVYEALAERKVTLVTTDAPDLENLFRGGWEAVGEFGYVRLHGRNRDKWWEHDEGWERYNYLYSNDEITGMAKAVKTLAGEGEGEQNDGSSRDVYVFFNNHWQAQGAINALQLALELGIEIPTGGLPDTILKKLNPFLNRE